MAAATLKTRGYAGEYTNIRQDGVWVDSGENDNLIVRKLMRDVDALGVFSFSFLEENQDKIQGARVDGVEVNFETISSGDYPLSRSLFFYIKKDHLKQVPGLYDYVRLFMAEEMIGENGQLTRLGLVPLPAQLREASRDRVMKLEPLTLREARLGTLDQYARQHGLVSE